MAPKKITTESQSLCNLILDEKVSVVNQHEFTQLSAKEKCENLKILYMKLLSFFLSSVTYRNCFPDIFSSRLSEK